MLSFMKPTLLISVLFVFCFGCNPQVEQKIEQKNEFLEVRINRWTALEGGEIFVLRKINNDWSAMLLGDGDRFSCLYNKSVQPKSNWEDFWKQLQSNGLLEISDGRRLSNSLDGRGYYVEIIYQNNIKRYSFKDPEGLKTKESEQIQKIGDLISKEFETPMFSGKYGRGEIGDYLIEQCKNRPLNQDSIH